MFTPTLIIFILTAVYLLLKVHYRYWEKRGIVGPKPTILLGNMGRVLFRKTSPGELSTEIYNRYPDRSIVGIYRGLTPSLLIRDPELIKDITISNFSNFQHNEIKFDKSANQLYGRNPFVLRDDEWKTVRGQLTPAFTNGKLKLIYPLLEDVCQKLVNYIDEHTGEGHEATILSKRFTLHNVACTTFDLDPKCFEEEKSKFTILADELISPGIWANLISFLTGIFPLLYKMYPFSVSSKEGDGQLIRIVSEALKYREENNVIRNDFLNIFGDLKKTCKAYEFTDLHVAAHGSVIVQDGYDTTSRVMGFVLYMLADNIEKQRKLRSEISRAFEGNDQKLPYDVLSTLSYLDGVVKETLRMNPPIYVLHKLCTNPFTFTLKETNGSISIEKGTPIVLPIHGIQNDSKYFEDPEMFKPERFVGSNKENIKKFTFIPFGEGPRACFGQRFGVLQIKAGVSYIVNNFELSVNKKTQLPLKLDPWTSVVSRVEGLWIDFKRIT